MAKILGEGNERVVGAFIIGLCVGMLILALLINSKPSNEYPEDATCFPDDAQGKSVICY